MTDQDYNSAIELNKKRIQRFQKIEGRPWGAEGCVIELAKQVGELSALVMTKEGYYFKNRENYSKKYSTNTDDVADELADILFAITRLAMHYKIDLIEATKRAHQGDLEWFKEKGIEY